MKLTTPLLALSLAAALPACTDDDSGRPGPDAITWRVPCGAQGHWTSNPGALDTSTYVNDARKHQIEATVVDSTGATWSHVTRGYQGDRFSWADVVTGDTTSYRSDATYDGGGLMIRSSRTDRVTENGDTSHTITYVYGDDGAMVSLDVDYVSADFGDIHSEITGELSEHETTVDCLISDPTVCDTYTFEQPDRNPYHWTAGTLDLGSDGVIDYRWERPLDRNGLEVGYIETDFTINPAGVVSYRHLTQREADGTVISTTSDVFDGDGLLVDTYTLENAFTCAGARLAATPSAPATIVRVAPTPHLPIWRRAAQ